MFVVYKITHRDSGKFYIGKTSVKTFKTTYMGAGSGIRAAVAEYGIDAFDKQIIAEFTDEADAYAREGKECDPKQVADPMCYNLHPGGSGAFSGKGNPMYGTKSPMLGKTGENNPSYGRKYPQRKLAAPRFFGKRPEHSKRMTGKNNPSYGGWSPEMRVRMMETRFRNKLTKQMVAIEKVYPITSGQLINHGGIK